jgi:hypothetical protein
MLPYKPNARGHKMILDLQNIEIDLKNIDTLPEETQLIMYKFLNAKFKNSPKIYGKSFEKISDNEYKIFGLTFAPSQILVLNDCGQATLDGNNVYYWKPEYEFFQSDIRVIKERFGRFTEAGEKYGLRINQVVVVPVAEGIDSRYARCLGEVSADPYNFDKPESYANALVVPFTNGRVLDFGLCRGARPVKFPESSLGRPLDFGIFSAARVNLPGFAQNVARVVTK